MGESVFTLVLFTIQICFQVPFQVFLANNGRDYCMPFALIPKLCRRRLYQQSSYFTFLKWKWCWKEELPQKLTTTQGNLHHVNMENVLRPQRDLRSMYFIIQICSCAMEMVVPSEFRWILKGALNLMIWLCSIKLYRSCLIMLVHIN